MTLQRTVIHPVLVAALLLSVILTGCGTTSPATPPAPPADSAARIVRAEQGKGRIWDLTIHSPAVGADVPVRLLLPAAYRREPQRRWPVLYLLHGCFDTNRSWSRFTDVEKLTRDAQLKGTRLFVSAGNGRPDPLDQPGATADQIDLYEPGTHNWVYWQRELHRAWPLIRQGLDLQD